MNRHIPMGLALAVLLPFLLSPVGATPLHPEHPGKGPAGESERSDRELRREPRPDIHREGTGPERNVHADPLGGSGTPEVHLKPPTGAADSSPPAPLEGATPHLQPDPTVRFYQEVTDALDWNRRARSQGEDARTRAQEVFARVTAARERAVEALPEGAKRDEARNADAGPMTRNFDRLVERGRSQGLEGSELYDWVIRESAVQPLYTTAAQGPSAIKPWEMPDVVTPNPSLVKLENAAEARKFRPLEKATYLWVLGPRGELRVGIETQTPRPGDPAQVGQSVAYNGRPVNPESQRYGHPTLVHDLPRHEALYAGELFHKDGQWYINADSGRFGRDRRSPEQGRELLAQARMLFKNYAGLNVRVGERFAEGAVSPDTPATELGRLLDQVPPE